MIPDKLADWTYDIIAELVKKNICESDRHDFKFKIPDADTLSKVCCAFANTKGGFVILGVKQVGSCFTIEGIDNNTELAHEFGAKINNKITPTIDFDLPMIIDIPNSGKVIAIFHIPLSPQRPHMTQPKDQGFFWKRTNKGNDQMTFQEISMTFQNYEERREKLKLLYVELLSNLDQLRDMTITETESNVNYSLVTLDSIIINNLLTDLFTIIGSNMKLVEALFIIKTQIKVINNKVQIFFALMARPIIEKGSIIKKHNDFIKKQADDLIPLIKAAIDILENTYNLKNPLKD
jgi:predicted HTH transcriptional regulator